MEFWILINPPGIAALSTLGMAVDANVLINERVRQGLEKAAMLRMQWNKVSRRSSGLLLMNVTTLIAAVVLLNEQLRSN